ncbi:MAG: hypothetical protein COA97_10380 [Flavobacteriales bacterium]|nr:MAG: hypothetical protein COA97_10380 [Flavobacteriales bacterium]
MRIFVCNRSSDSDKSKDVLKTLLECSGNSIAILQEIKHSENWKQNVGKKFQEVDFVLFLLGEDTFQSEQVKWEFSECKKLNKRIIAIKLDNISNESLNFCEGIYVFDNSEQCFKYLEKSFEDNQKLRLEQYKIMVGSTEKVTDQRLKVNNLFFTVTSSILSISVVLGKAFDFTIFGTIGMVVLTLLAFLVSFFWEKLINSYGQLNKGKFKVIDKIEKQLRTNMFEDEWNILTQEIKYEPNTKTEAKIIQRFRIFIGIIGSVELIYLGYQLIKLIPICKC